MFLAYGGKYKDSVGTKYTYDRCAFFMASFGFFIISSFVFLLYFAIFVVNEHPNATSWYHIHVTLMKPIHLFWASFIFSFINIIRAVNFLEKQWYKKTKYFWLFFIPCFNNIFYILENLYCLLIGILACIIEIKDLYVASDENETENMIKRITKQNKKATERLEKLTIKSKHIVAPETLRDYERTIQVLKQYS